MEDNRENYLKKKDIAMMVGVLMFIIPVVVSYFQIQTDIALMQQSIETIKSNHLSHTQDLVQEMKEMKIRDTERDKQIVEMQKQILILINSK